MDITQLIKDIGRLNKKEFEEVLYKRVKQEYYYVFNFKGDHGKWSYEVLKVEGSSEDIVKRIKLFDQPSTGKVGVSYGLGTFINPKRLEEVFDYAGHYKEEFKGIKEDWNKGLLEWPVSEEEALELWENVHKMRGYATVALNGKYIVDVEGYVDQAIHDLYGNMRKGIEEEDHCYLCGEDKDLIHGGFKEPAWKFLSVTRTSGLAEDKKAFIRCMGCEELVMKGSHYIQEMSKYHNKGTKTYEELIIPLTDKKVVWNQLKDLRKETGSDLKFYEGLEGKMDRWEMRGVEMFLQMRILRNQRNYTVLNNQMVHRNQIRRLESKKSFTTCLWDKGWWVNGKGLPYYPEPLIESDNERKFYWIEQIKRYWLGLPAERDLWGKVEKFCGMDKGKLAVYEVWNEYVELGENGVLEQVEGSRMYALGKLMGLARTLQEKEKKKYRVENSVSIRRRFRECPRDVERAFEMVLRVLDVDEQYLKSEEKVERKKWSEQFMSAENKGKNRDYYLGLM